MKINKRKPAHWAYLIIFACNVILAVMLRPFLRAPDKALVLLYGHKLNGNLRALYDEIQAQNEPPCQIAFLTMDPVYYKELLHAGEACVLALSPRAAVALARVRCIVSDHGLHVMQPLVRLRNIRFVDVWHGIPYKGWVESDFRVQHNFDEIWLSSNLMRRLYVQRFGFREDQVHATGYGRVDRLVTKKPVSPGLRGAIGGAQAEKIVLFAPTWRHGALDHDIVPFGIGAEAFFAELARICTEHKALCLLRTHLNTDLPPIDFKGVLRAVPADEFPDTEALLQLSDVLICDWSSIAFDYLVLARPTIFLDVPAPFAHGFSLGPEYRYGAIAKDLFELSSQLSNYLDNPADYQRAHAVTAARIKQDVYDNLADGRAASRYRERLVALL